MKSNVRLFLVTALFSLFIGMLDSCKRPTEDIDLIVNTDIYPSPVFVRFVNANSKALNQPGDFKVSVTGKDASLVNAGDGGTDFKAVNGMITLALNTGAHPTPENPVTFMVSADIPGFKKANQLITLTGDGEDEPAQYIIPAQDYNNPAEGTAALINTTPMSGGTVTALETMTTSTGPKLSQKATIKIKAGTKMMDESGNPVGGNSLESKIIFYSTESQEALNSFPGGFVATDVIGENGQPVPGGGTFITGGFLSIDMQSGNKEVKQFSEPIEVKAELANDLVNPETGSAVKAGDEVPIWSLNEETGQWKYESKATVSMSGGKPSVSFSASHLSCWNIDWFCYVRCPGPLSIKIVCDPNYQARLWLHLETPNGQYLGGIYTNNTWSTPVMLYNGYTNNLAWLPGCILQTKICLYDRYTYRKICETPIFNPCASGQVIVTIPAQAAPDIVTIKLNMKGKCGNRNITTNLTGWAILFNNANWYDYSIINVKNGKATLRLPNGGTYTFAAVYNGQLYTTTVTLNKTNFTFPAVNGLTGNGTFDAATNTLTLNGTIQIPNCN